MGSGKPSLRRATRKDVDLLVAWHADPETSRFWDDQVYSREELLEKFERERWIPFIVVEDGLPVGYLQQWWEEGSRVAGLDGFLIPSARGRGVMPAVVRELAGRLLDEGWESVTVDPYAWNEQGVRGWAKAGFVEESRHPPDDEHTAEWVLMRFRR